MQRDADRVPRVDDGRNVERNARLERLELLRRYGPGSAASLCQDVARVAGPDGRCVTGDGCERFRTT